MAHPQSHDASLVSPAHQGGVTGGKGYNYQDAFIVSRIPEWLADPSFVCLLKEGIEDVEVQFKRSQECNRLAYQVKDHRLTASECREVIAGFSKKDLSTPGTFSKFFLACRGLPNEAIPFRTALKRLQEASSMYGSADRVLRDTKQDLQERAENLGLTVNLKFLEEKLFFDTELGDMTSDERLCQQFVGGIHEHFSQWSKASWVALVAAYHDLAHWINCSIGKTCLRDEFLQKIQRAINVTAPRLDKEGTLVRLYHWEDHSFDLSGEWDILLDWSEYFHRATRKVPPSLTWQNRLLPELEEVQRHVRASTNSRHIRFRPSACLSAGFALGWAFSEVKGYTFEVKQGPAFWTTDVPLATGQQWIVSQKKELVQSSSRLCIELSQQADVAPRVDSFLKNSGLSCRTKISLVPSSGIGSRIDGPAALAYANHAKQIVRQAVDQYKCTVVDLFYAGPLGLAVFLGRLFNAMHADIQCYEEQPDEIGYRPSCLLHN